MNDWYGAISSKIFYAGSRHKVSASLEQSLLAFTRQHYDNLSQLQFILQPEAEGFFIVYYNKDHKIIGFTRTKQQSIKYRGKIIQVLSSQLFNQSGCNLYSLTARLILTEIMKYKLANPQENLMYFTCVSSSDRYRFLCQLNKTIYPNAFEKEPEELWDIAARIKVLNGWRPCPKHPMMISGMPTPKIKLCDKEPLKSRDYYTVLNADPAAGEALLAYVPLSLDAIGHSIKHLVQNQTAA